MYYEIDREKKMQNLPITLAWTGASGLQYGLRLFLSLVCDMKNNAGIFFLFY